jgi:hypothetical protein
MNLPEKFAENQDQNFLGNASPETGSAVNECGSVTLVACSIQICIVIVTNGRQIKSFQIVF